MTFSSRLYAAFAACVAFTLAIGAFAVFEVSTLSAHTRAISGNWMPSVSTLIDIKSQMREFRTQELQHILSTDAAEMDRWESRMADTLRDIDAKMAIAEKLASTPEEREKLAQLRREQEARREGHMRVRALSRQGRNAEALALARGEVATLRAATAATIDALVELNEKGARDEVARAESAAAFARIGTPAAAAFSVLVALALALWIVRTTMRQLGGDPEATRAAVDRIASGDLATPIALRPGDAGSLLASLATMRERLATLVTAIVSGSHEIRNASEEVAKGNLDLSSRTEQQSSSLQETASALEEITGTVRATADNAGSANQLAMAASETAARGGASVDALVTTMQEIADRSRSVQRIIGVIDGIAFQTNILALNAAVEAARAGESGRGFAVVASEVRTLAQRSADAAREIKGLIDAAAGKVDEGTRIAGEAGSTMSEVTTSVRRVTDIIGEIASAAREQTTGVVQINEAVSQLDAVTQQNAALVEQAAAATQSMEEQADRLVAAVSAFRVDASRSGETGETGERPVRRDATPAAGSVRVPAAARPAARPASRAGVPPTASPTAHPTSPAQAAPARPQAARHEPAPAASTPSAARVTAPDDSWQSF